MALDTPTREHLYQRAIDIATTYASGHPQVLSAAMLIGRAQLGLANMTKDGSSRHTHAASAAEQFSKVLAAHTTHPEASRLLAAAHQAGAE